MQLIRSARSARKESKSSRPKCFFHPGTVGHCGAKQFELLPLRTNFVNICIALDSQVESISSVRELEFVGSCAPGRKWPTANDNSGY